MFDLIDYIDLVQESVNDSDAEVLMAMAATYTKSLQIMESVTEDSDLYDSIFQETEVPTGTPNHAKSAGGDSKSSSSGSGDTKLRSTNFFMKALRFIKRLWQQIITMVSSQVTKISIKRAKKAISNAKGDRVKSPYDDSDLNAFIEDMGQLEKYCSEVTKQLKDKSNLKSLSKDGFKDFAEAVGRFAMNYDKKAVDDQENALRKMKMDQVASKNTITKYFDAAMSAMEQARVSAKYIDRFVDAFIQNMSNGERSDYVESVTKEGIDALNNASTRTFKSIRAIMKHIRIEASFFIKDKKNLTAKDDEPADTGDYEYTEYATETDVFSLIMESYEADHWSQLFLEADDTGSIRRTNIFAKTIRFIKRLWQQILTLLTSQMMKHTIKRAKKAISNTSGDIVKSNTTDDVLNNTTKFYKTTAENYNNACKLFKDNKSDKDTINALARSTMTTVELFKKLDNGDIKMSDMGAVDANTTIDRTASKKSLLDFFDAAADMIDAAISFAKIVDRVLDKYVSNNSKSDIENDYYGATLSQDAIDSINKSSTIMFKRIRHDCKEIRDVAKPFVSERKNLETKDDNSDTVQGTYDDDEE